jgi:hypothetical protein
MLTAIRSCLAPCFAGAFLAAVARPVSAQAWFQQPSGEWDNWSTFVVSGGFSCGPAERITGGTCRVAGPTLTLTDVDGDALEFSFVGPRPA